MWQYRQTDELYHYGVPGMKWGVKKATYEAKADSYRKAASNEIGKKQERLIAKADKFTARANSLDTDKGKRTETFRDIGRGAIKVGTHAVSAVLGAIGGVAIGTGVFMAAANRVVKHI